MNYNPSPREEFIRNPENVKSHHILVENNALRLGLSIALAEYTRRQTKLNAPDLGGCAACHLRTTGAQEFVEVFLNLCESMIIPSKQDTTNLPSNVKPLPVKK